MKKPKYNDTPVTAFSPRHPSRLEKQNADLRYHVAIMEKNSILIGECINLIGKEHEGAVEEKAHPRDVEREDELKRLRIENIEFRRLGAEEKEVRRLNRVIMTLQDRVDEKCRDCKLLEMTLKIAREDNAKLQSVAAMAPRPRNYFKQ